MTPILYAENVTTFSSQGIGSLSDAISCTVTEERNGIFELEMTYPVDGIHYEDITHSKIIKATPRPGGDDQLFRIYGITRPINGIVTVNAEHISYQLSYIPVKTFEANSLTEALQDLTTYVPAGVDCPFTFTSTMTSTTGFENRVISNIREKLGGSEGSILDVYGGEWEFDNYTVKLWQNRGANRDVTLRYGKNITDITQEENIANTYTGAVGYYASGDGDYVETDVINTPSTSSYPFKRIEVVDLSSEFSDGAPDKEELTEVLGFYMDKHQYGIPKVSIKVSFVQLWQTEEYKDIAPLERVWLCDTINVRFEKLGISTTAKIVKVVYNVLLDRYDSIEVGETTPNLSDRVAAQEIETKEKVDDTKNELEKAILRATEAITGQKGGYVVIDTDANGQPTQILIMDKPTKTQATKVWRWDLGGLGYSDHGVNGPFTTAITADGEIVADFITVGTLTANLIKAGILKSIATQRVGNVDVPIFQLDIDTGILKALKLIIDSPNFTLTEQGVATMTGAHVSGTADTTGTYQTNIFKTEMSGGVLKFFKNNVMQAQILCTTAGSNSIILAATDWSGQVDQANLDVTGEVSARRFRVLPDLFDVDPETATIDTEYINIGDSNTSIVRIGRYSPTRVIVGNDGSGGTLIKGDSIELSGPIEVNGDRASSGSFYDRDGNLITVTNGLITGGIS